MAIPRRRPNWLDGAAQFAGAGAKDETVKLERRSLVSRSRTTRTKSSAAGEAYRQATHTPFLDAGEAYAFLDELPTFEWTLRELEAISPFSFPIYASVIKESMMLEDPATAL